MAKTRVSWQAPTRRAATFLAILSTLLIAWPMAAVAQSAGMTVSKATAAPTEAGTADTFTVVLDDQGNGMRTGNPILFEIFSVSREKDSITFEFNSRPGKIYAVDYSFDFDLWLEVDDGVEATARTTSFTDENPELLEFPKVFYRVREQ